MQFSDFWCDLLTRSEQMLEAVVELWNASIESGSKLDPARLCPKQELYSGTPESSRDTPTEHPEASSNIATPTTAPEVSPAAEEGNPSEVNE